MLAVLVILITAPIGAVGITLAGPRLLNRNPKPESRETAAEEKKTNRDVEDGEREVLSEQDDLIRKDRATQA